MNFSRPTLALAAYILASAACTVSTDPDPLPGTAGSLGAAGTPSGGSSVAGTPAGGTAPTGTAGSPATGGSPAGGSAATAGSATGGTSGAGTAGSGSGGGGSNAGGSAGSGSGGGSGNKEGPCDIYKTGGNPCVAAYSTIRRLLSTYTGPLYQVRTGSSAQNTGTGGTPVDVGQTADGFADIAAQNTACANTLCTVAKLYDQSGKGNDITVAKAGLTNGGQYAGMDDFETTVGRTDTKDKIKVGGRDVYSLYMEARQGYRQTKIGAGMAVGDQPQGIYMLADGTRTGTACCWDFGNVTTNPKSYAEMNTLFFGVAFWGKGAGNGPWFGADFEAGVWMGGSKPGEPGWGGLNDAANAPANSANPSMKVKYALGFQKTANTPERYALRMADVATASTVTTAYAGNYPQGKHLDAKGAVVLGVGGDNSNNSWSTFYEGAIVQGYPPDASENAVLQNIKALGYGQ
jgi:non-reducing end alpha-L-arabinofuranosidase